MPYVSVPKDLSRVKNKILFGLTKRQLICFSIAAAIGVPVYIFTRGAIGNSAAALLMIAVMLPLFFLAMYEKDGQPAEVVLRNYFRATFFWPRNRPNVAENTCTSPEKEDTIAAKSETTAKKTGRERAAGKRKS